MKKFLLAVVAVVALSLTLPMAVEACGGCGAGWGFPVARGVACVVERGVERRQERRAARASCVGVTACAARGVIIERHIVIDRHLVRGCVIGAPCGSP